MLTAAAGHQGCGQVAVRDIAGQNADRRTGPERGIGQMRLLRRPQYNTADAHDAEKRRKEFELWTIRDIGGQQDAIGFVMFCKIIYFRELGGGAHHIDLEPLKAAL